MQVLLHNAQQMLQVIVATFPHFEPIGTDSTPCNAKSQTEDVKLACMWAKALETRSLWQHEQATTDQVVKELSSVRPDFFEGCSRETGY